MTIEMLEILAVSDEAVFENALNQVGLTIMGRTNTDPLQKETLAEQVGAIASEITEDRHDYVDVSRLTLEAKKLAEDYGYIIGFIDE